MNNHQTIEDILKTADPTQKILWNDIFLRYGERLSVTQVVLRGTGAGYGEIGSFIATKLYFIYQLTYAMPTIGVTIPYMTLFDRSNTAFLNVGDSSVYWDGSAAAYRSTGNVTQLKNEVFSRLSASANGIYFEAIGYRIMG